MYHYYKQMLGEDDPATKNAKAMLDVTRSQVQDAYSEPGFIGNSTLKEAVPAVIGYMAMSADVEALAQTKALLTTSLEKAQLESKTSSHNFFIVDAAVPADEKDKPKRTLIVAGSTIGGFILGLLIILLINGFRVAYRQAKSIRKSEKAERSKQ
jgi:LPS O-antigen subunit length determinant protein (WzzB/FepE family)